MRATPSAIRLTACDLGASVWLVQLAGRSVLFDSWLDDPYVSGGAGFFKAWRKQAPVLTVEKLPLLDLLIVTSREQDHCHPVTLARLRRDLPVHAHRSALRVFAELGFAQRSALAPGTRSELFGGDAELLALKGYGNNLAILLADAASGERVCIAQHGVHAGWLSANARASFAGAFAPRANGSVVDTLCLGVYTTLLRPRFWPASLLPDRGTIVPPVEESAALVERLRPRRIFFTHNTPEHEQGFAVRHLLAYPHRHDAIEHASAVLRARTPFAHVAGLPAPGEPV